MNDTPASGKVEHLIGTRLGKLRVMPRSLERRVAYNLMNDTGRCYSSVMVSPLPSRGVTIWPQKRGENVCPYSTALKCILLYIPLSCCGFIFGAEESTGEFLQCSEQQ